MAGPTSSVPCKKPCVCGPFYAGGKINYPLWWYGEQTILYGFNGGTIVPTNCAWMNHGYYFNGGSSYLLDEQDRKILKEGTTGLWSSINLEGDVPPWGSITGSGTVLKINNGSALPPEIDGSLILYPQCCPNLTHLYCDGNSFSVLDVSALTNLVYLHCSDNSISVFNINALTNLTYLRCYRNPISVFDVSALTNLTRLYCYSSSMNQAMVDTVLCDMDGHGTSNGILNIYDNAVPSATGITCKNNLIARGWTVTTS